MSRKRKTKKTVLTTTDVIPREVMASTKITNSDPIHEYNDDTGLPLKNTFSMLEAYNLIYGTTAWGRRKGRKPYPHQLRFQWKVVEATCLKTNKEIFNLCSRQSGKTTSIGDATYNLAMLPSLTSFFYKEDLTVTIFAPKREQARKDMRQFTNLLDTGWAEENLGITKTVDSKDEVLLSNGVLVQTGSASINAKPEGITSNCLILEEAQDIDDIRIKKSCFPMTAHTGGPRVLSGTPTPERRGYFYHRLRELTTNHPDVIFAPYTEVIKYSLQYRNYIRRELKHKRLNKDSIEFQTQFELIWADSENRFIDEARLYALRNNKMKMVKSADTAVSIGIDVAKRMDTSVVSVVAPLYDINRVYNWYELAGKYTNQARQVVDIFRNYPNRFSIVIDTFGAGDGFCDILEEEMSRAGMSTDAIVRKPMNPANKSAIYKNMKRLCDNLAIEYPGEETVERFKFEQEMLNLVVKWNGDKMLPEAPRGMHDDYTDSMALALYGLRFAALNAEDLITTGVG